VTVFAACDGPIRLEVVTAIPPERPGGSGSGGAGNAGNSAGTGNIGAGNEAGAGSAGSAGDGGGEGGEGGGGEPGGAGGSEGPPPWEAPTLYQASFASLALPGDYIRYQDALGAVTPIDPVTRDAFDATFEVIDGMVSTTDEQCFSIRRLGGDYSFIRHSSFRIQFTLAHDEPLFLGDATFCFRPGLAEETWVSFESYNLPNHYIRVRDSAQMGTELWIDPDDGSATFAAEATFRIENPFEQPD